jgi:hypothetical protein
MRQLEESLERKLVRSEFIVVAVRAKPLAYPLIDLN